MLTSSDTTPQQKAPEGSSVQPACAALAGAKRGPKPLNATKPLSVVILCGVSSVRHHAPTDDTTVALAVGGPHGAPHIAGVRASRALWVQFVTGLLKADPFLRAQVTAKLAASA